MNTSEQIRRIWAEKNVDSSTQKHLAMMMSLQASSEERQILFEKIAKWVLDRVPKPKDGYTPVKGRDYFDGKTPTDKELLALIKPLIPKEKDYLEAIKETIRNEMPTREDLEEIIEPLIPYVKDGQDGQTPGKAELENIIRPIILSYMEGSSKETPQLTYDQIKGVAEPIIRQMMTETRKGWFGGGGGGDNVRAGSGVTITTNNIGAKVISVSGSSLELEATGTINSDNTTFTFTEKPAYIFSDGAKYKENAGWTWDSGTLTATMSVPPQFSIWGER
jgi:hypothetical protein